MQHPLRITVLVLLILPALSLAQDGFPGDDLPEDAYIPPIQHVEFDEVGVKGVLDGPGVVMVPEIQHRPFSPFIELRRNFSEEIRASVDEIR